MMYISNFYRESTRIWNEKFFITNNFNKIK